MSTRIIISGKNHDIPRNAFAAQLLRFPSQQSNLNSGITPESAAGGSRCPEAPRTVIQSDPCLPSLWITLVEGLLYCVLFFGAGFGLAWTLP